MGVQCPNCGSRFLRESKARDASEKSAQWRFRFPLRCLDCKTRFIASTFNFRDLIYASCPKCDRMDLNRWTETSYEPPFWTDLKAKLGANRWRCEYCRYNFASWRRRKEVFTFRRWRKLNSGAAVAVGRARIAEMEARAHEQREAEEALLRTQPVHAEMESDAAEPSA